MCFNAQISHKGMRVIFPGSRRTVVGVFFVKSPDKDAFDLHPSEHDMRKHDATDHDLKHARVTVQLFERHFQLRKGSNDLRKALGEILVRGTVNFVVAPLPFPIRMGMGIGCPLTVVEDQEIIGETKQIFKMDFFL